MLWTLWALAKRSKKVKEKTRRPGERGNHIERVENKYDREAESSGRLYGDLECILQI